jgi:hypothetical protein
MLSPVDSDRFINEFNEASRLAAALRGHDFNFHKDQILITTIDNIVLDSGSPEVCHAGGKLCSRLAAAFH